MHVFLREESKAGFLSRVDPRVKLYSGIALLAMVLTYHGFLFPLVVALLSLSLCLALGVPVKRLLFRFSEPAFIVAVLILLKLFFTGKEVLWTFHLLGTDLTAHRDGLMEGLIIACRIISGVSLIALLSFSTPFTEFLGALTWMRVPRGMVEISIFAYRYIFLLLDDASVIYSAQKNRLGYSSLRRALSSFGVLAGSLTVKAFDNSQHAALAMAQRGYDGRMPLAGQRPLALSQVALSALFIVLMGIAWMI
jgi:cobalt/nickel transport system permease protein